MTVLHSDISSEDSSFARDTGFSETLVDQVAGVPYWWHSVDLGSGIVTPGQKSAQLLAAELENLRLGDLRGKSVLDVGAWDGYFSFAAERLGADLVLALDHYVWRSQLSEHGVPGNCPLAPAGELPGRAGFDVAHRALNSRVLPVVADVATADLRGLGHFDVVLFLGVLYHLENPLSVLRKLRALTRGVLVLETEAVLLPGYEQTGICEFHEGAELNNDATNWWSPNARAVEGMCRAAGFADVTTIVGPPQSPENPRGRRARVRHARTSPARSDGKTVHYRHVLHAR